MTHDVGLLIQTLVVVIILALLKDVNEAVPHTVLWSCAPIQLHSAENIQSRREQQHTFTLL